MPPEPQPRPPLNRDQRADFRFDKIIPISYSSEEFAEIRAFARNISVGGMLIETQLPPPLATEVRIRFEIPDSHASILVRAEIKNHYVFNYVEANEPRVARGMGVRFLEFLEDGGERVRLSMTRWRVLH